jgi:hypothetical protein
MKELIEALQIMLRYFKNADEKFPTHCEHDILYVWGVDFDKIPLDDVLRLYELGFIPGSDYDCEAIDEVIGEENDFKDMTAEQWNEIKNNIDECFRSYKYGSC